MSEFKLNKPSHREINFNKANEAELKFFLNDISKQVGTIKNLGSYSDEIKNNIDTGIKAKVEYELVERLIHSENSPGDKYHYEDEPENVFEFNYNLPETRKDKIYIIHSTIHNHQCNPKEICNICHGKRYCTRCHGTGSRPGYSKTNTIKCSSCNGDGKCYKCGGTGEIRCRKCKGTGVFQTYNYFTNKYITEIKEYNYSNHIELKEKIFFKTNGNVDFDGILFEWENINTPITDNSKEFEKSDKFYKELLRKINDFKVNLNNNPNQKIAKISAYIEMIPINIISFKFENKEYELFIIGLNKIPYSANLPKKHFYRTSFFCRIIELFNKKKRKIAYLYIASYIFNSDTSVDSIEKKIIDLFLTNIKMKEEKKKELTNDLNRKLSIEDINTKIKCLKKDLRSLVFAWHCVILNEQASLSNKKEKELAFNNLINIYKIKNNIDIDIIKHKAAKFSRLKDEEMLKEYLKSY